MLPLPIDNIYLEHLNSNLSIVFDMSNLFLREIACISIIDLDTLALEAIFIHCVIR